MNQALKIEILSAVLEKTVTSLPSPQELAEARYQGGTAGAILLSIECNPYPKGSALNFAWNDARLEFTGRKLFRSAQLALANRGVSIYTKAGA